MSFALDGAVKCDSSFSQPQMLSGVRRELRLEGAIVVHRAKEIQRLAEALLQTFERAVVVLAECGSDVHDAGAGVEGDEVLHEHAPILRLARFRAGISGGLCIEIEWRGVA